MDKEAPIHRSNYPKSLQQN